jgi:hypothetical protein
VPEVTASMTQDMQPMTEDMQLMTVVMKSMTSVMLTVTLVMLTMTLIMPILAACNYPLSTREDALYNTICVVCSN